MMRSLVIRAGALVLLALSNACGGGGSDAAPATEDLTGAWLMYLTPSGSTTETGPQAVYLVQNGSFITGASTVGTMSGASFNMTTNGGSFLASFSGTATPTTATGNVTFSGGFSATGTFRLERYTPTGTLTASGMVGSSTVNMTSSLAYGSLDYGDVGLSMLDEVEFGAADAEAQLEIDFSPAGLAVGTLDVPANVTAVVLYRTGAVATESFASSGTVTVTQYDATSFAGSFTLTLDAGGTLTGTFAVSFDMESYDP